MYTFTPYLLAQIGNASLIFNNFSQMAEYRISIYGTKMCEWDQLASWVVNNQLCSQKVVWLIEVCSRSFAFDPTICNCLCI